MTATLPQAIKIDDPVSVATFRHDLVTPVNHIFGFAELLIDDARAKGRVYRTHSLTAIRAIAMDATRRIDQSLALDDPSRSPDVAALGLALIGPAMAIVEACHAIEEASVAVPDSPAFLDDLDRIKAAAVRLLNLARGFRGDR